VPVSLFRYFDFRVTARPRRVHGSDDTVHMLAQCWPLLAIVDLPSRRRTTSLKVRSCTREQISAARRECYTVRYGDLMSSGDSVIVKNPNILSGTPVFRGTRVPLQLLFDSLERGHTLEDFVEGYPTVSREMAVAALEEAQQLLSAQA
jgi:uncharacterized protein (DUF433 family)